MIVRDSNPATVPRMIQQSDALSFAPFHLPLTYLLATKCCALLFLDCETVFFNQSINHIHVFRRPNVLQGTRTEYLHQEWNNSPARYPLLHSVHIMTKTVL